MQTLKKIKGKLYVHYSQDESMIPSLAEKKEAVSSSHKKWQSVQFWTPVNMTMIMRKEGSVMGDPALVLE